MADCEDRLRGVLRAQAETFEPPADLRDRINDRAGDPTTGWRWRVPVAAAACVALVAGALGAAAVVGSGDGTETITAGPTGGANTEPVQLAPIDGWRKIAPAPIHPRSGGTAVFTGEEMLVFGGTETGYPCGSAALCDYTAEPVADGAAYNPQTDSWRPLNPAPVAFIDAESTWTGARMLVVPTWKDTVLAYDPAADGWETLAEVPAGVDPLGGTWTGSRWLFPTRDGVRAPAWAYDPATDGWSTLPEDPIGRTGRRHLAWTGEELVLLGVPLPVDPNLEPALYEAAAYDPESGQWRRLAGSEVHAGVSDWVAVGDLVVNPTTTVIDMDEDGQGHALGGIYDLGGDRWTEVPPPPEEATLPSDRDPRFVFAMDLDRAGGWVVTSRPGGAILFDPAGRRWHPVPQGPELGEDGVSVWTGTEIITWGGTVDDPTGEAGSNLTGAGAAYRPPPTA